MKVKNFNKLIEHQFADLYSAEKQLTKVLPKLADASTTPLLKKGFEEHLSQTKEHVKRLEKAASLCGFKIKAITCKGIKGLIDEGKEVLESVLAGTLLDTALIGAAQRVEHYEIAAYGTLITHMEEIELKDAADVLKMTLNEEEKTNEKLSDIAMKVNSEAALVNA